MLMPLDLPPGIFRNGTDLQSSGRWRDASLVRWREGSMQPIGGWQQRVNLTVGAVPRGMHAWLDNSGDRHIALAAHSIIYHISASGTVTDITPGGFTSGTNIATVNRGYGGGFYDVGLYGTTRPDGGTYSEVTTWSMDNWGETLVACSSTDGVLYDWDLNTANNLVALSNAPTSCLGLTVTEGRFLFALGAGGDPRKVQWSDREDNETWTPTATNEAGDFILQTQGRIMQGLRVRGGQLLLTDRDAHTATETGDILVFGFEQVGTACGAVSRRAAAPVEGGAMWMGVNGFFRFNGGVVEDLPCEVSDFVFDNINSSQASQIWAVPNSLFNEVWWFYPSSASTKCDRYVAFNYQEGFWMLGELDRSAGVDRGVFPSPIWVDDVGVSYDHETGFNHDPFSEEVFCESGPVSLDTGENTFTLTKLIPDEQTQGEVTVTFKTRFYPNGAETSTAALSMANPTDVRISGRQMRLRVTGDADTDWRWGIPRVELQQRGRR